MRALEKLKRYQKAIESYCLAIENNWRNVPNKPRPEDFQLTSAVELEMARRIREQMGFK